MAINSLQDLFVNKLQMIYDAERQGFEAMQRMAQQVSNPDVRRGIDMHRGQTQQQIQRLEQLFQQQGQRAQAKECQSMRALIQEGEQMLKEIRDDATRDAFIISAQQAVEHHEMADYGTARTWARQLGMNDAASVLQQTLQEEEQADRMLTQIAEQLVNPQAAQRGEREVSRGATMGDRATGAGATGETGARRDRGADELRNPGT